MSTTMDLTEGKTQAVHDEGTASHVGLVDPTDVEKINQEELQGKESPTLRLDKRGLPLVPQPTPFKDDPLVSQRAPLLVFYFPSN
jgi:hypothetical protein